MHVCQLCFTSGEVVRVIVDKQSKAVDVHLQGLNSEHQAITKGTRTTEIDVREQREKLMDCTWD